MRTTVLIDSGCGMSDELVQTYHVKTMRLHIIYPEKDCIDGTDITAETAYQRFPREIPIASTPSPQDVREMLDETKSEGYTRVLAFYISSSLSGTFNTVGYTLEEGTDLTSFMLDIRSISSEAGILAVWVAMQLGEGRTLDELREILPGKIKDSKVSYYMDTLTYLRKGGHIGLVTSVVGNTPNIKPIISCNGDGVCYTTAEVRDAKQGLTRFLEETEKFADNGSCLTTLLSGQGQNAAGTLHLRLTTGVPNGTLIMEKAITAFLAAHTDPGPAGIGVLRL